VGETDDSKPLLGSRPAVRGRFNGSLLTRISRLRPPRIRVGFASRVAWNPPMTGAEAR
jgi:hypothetical protein